MGRGAKSHTVTANSRVIRLSGVQDVRAVDFLGLMEALNQAEVRRHELGLVEVVVDGLAGDRVAESNFSMLLVVHVTLASAVVESSLAAFSLQLRQAEEPHFGGALKSHL